MVYAVEPEGNHKAPVYVAVLQGEVESKEEGVIRAQRKEVDGVRDSGVLEVEAIEEGVIRVQRKEVEGVRDSGVVEVEEILEVAEVEEILEVAEVAQILGEVPGVEDGQDRSFFNLALYLRLTLDYYQGISINSSLRSKGLKPRYACVFCLKLPKSNMIYFRRTCLCDQAMARLVTRSP